MAARAVFAASHRARDEVGSFHTAAENVDVSSLVREKVFLLVYSFVWSVFTLASQKRKSVEQCEI